MSSGKAFFQDLLEGKVKGAGGESPVPKSSRLSIDSVTSEAESVDLIQTMRGAEKASPEPTPTPTPAPAPEPAPAPAPTPTPAPAPAPTHRTGRPETLEEKIARVMRGISGPSAAPKREPVVVQAKPADNVPQTSEPVKEKEEKGKEKIESQPQAHAKKEKEKVQVEGKEEAYTPQGAVGSNVDETAAPDIDQPVTNQQQVSSAKKQKQQRKQVQNNNTGSLTVAVSEGDPASSSSLSSSSPAAVPTAPGELSSSLSPVEQVAQTPSSSSPVEAEAPRTSSPSSSSSSFSMGSSSGRQTQGTSSNNGGSQKAMAKEKEKHNSKSHMRSSSASDLISQEVDVAGTGPNSTAAHVKEEVDPSQDLEDGNAPNESLSKSAEHIPLTTSSPARHVSKSVLSARRAIKKIDLNVVEPQVGGLLTADPKPRRIGGATKRTRNDKFHYFGSAATHHELISKTMETHADSPYHHHHHGKGKSNFTSQPRRLPVDIQGVTEGASPAVLAFPAPPSWKEPKVAKHCNRQWSLYQRQLSAAAAAASNPQDTGSHVCDVTVALRIRPFNVGEIREAAKRIVSVKDDLDMPRCVLVNPNAVDASPDIIAALGAATSNQDWVKTFNVHKSFWSYNPKDTEDVYATQEDVYKGLGEPMVREVLNGVSTSCFAYGHTGTGKTHTMFGSLVSAAVEEAHLEEDRLDKEAHDKSLLLEDHEHSDGECEATSDHHHHPEGHVLGANAVAAEAKQVAHKLISPDGTLDENLGLIPRVLTEIVSRVVSDPEISRDTRVTISFTEIYNERVRDLLCTDVDKIEDLRIREHPDIGTYVDGLTKVEVGSAEEVIRVLLWGTSHRIISTTLRNSKSSRSHSMVTLELSPRASSARAPGDKSAQAAWGARVPATTSVVHAKGESVRIQLVDLAGSEEDKEHANGRPYFNSKDPRPYGINATLKTSHEIDIERLEHRTIRQSLSSLGYILRELGRGASARSLPFRESVLTWLMKDMLLGRAHCTMLAAISPASTCFNETRLTLKYMERLMVGSLRPRSAHKEGSPATATDLAKFGEGMERGGVRKHTANANVNDPQRFAKAPSSRRATKTTPKSSSSGYGSTGNVKAYDTGGGGSSAYGAADALKSLNTKYKQLELELANTRTVRDALEIEVEGLREAAVIHSQKHGHSKGYQNHDHHHHTNSSNKQDNHDTQQSRDVIAELQTSLQEAIAAKAHVEKEVALAQEEREAAVAREEALISQLDAAEAALTGAREASKEVCAMLEAEKKALASRVAVLEQEVAGHEQGEREVESIVKALQEMAVTGEAESARLQAENEVLRRELRAVDKELLSSISADGSPVLKKSTHRAAMRKLAVQTKRPTQATVHVPTARKK